MKNTVDMHFIQCCDCGKNRGYKTVETHTDYALFMRQSDECPYCHGDCIRAAILRVDLDVWESIDEEVVT
jgi:hypothetical protein